MSSQGGIPGIIRLMLFFLLLAVAYSYGWPLLQEQLGKGTSEGARCISEVSKLTSRFASRMYPFLDRRADRQVWIELKESTRGSLDAARAVCRCPQDSCRKGRTATDLLSRLVADINSSVEGGGLLADPDGRVSEIESWIEQGRSLARDGK